MVVLALVVALTAFGGPATEFTPPLTDPPAAASQVDDDASGQRAILITGASTGIGRATAEYLASKGFFVFAGARKTQDLADLSAIDNIQGIRLDVTIQEEIDAAVETVRAGGLGLYGLINNAGVVVISPLIEMSEEDLDFQLDVNVFGPYRVTAAFAPMIIESKGRISTTGSISGVLPWALGGAYCMSKHAVEAFTDVLARELLPFDVHVSVVEPGNYDSAIGKSQVKRLLDSGYSSEGSLYKEQMDSVLESMGERSVHKLPTEVAQAFYAAMTDEEPKQHYLVVPNQQEAEWTIRAVIHRLVQLNDSQAYSYDREALVAMLDEALTAAER